MTRPVEIHIDELVLDGVPGVDPARLGSQLSSELARLIGERGLPAGLASTRRVEAVLPRGAAPAGKGVAGAVYEGLGRCR